jgi:hypothetical protein
MVKNFHHWEPAHHYYEPFYHPRFDRSGTLPLELDTANPFIESANDL